MTKVTPRAYFKLRNAIDPVLAAILLIPSVPIIGLLVLAVRLTSRGPGIYRQPRMGKNGRLFTMYKIRTMRPDAEATTGPIWPKPNDPRTTPLGKVFRKLHLDELPQLFNVLKGDMYLIGPRPERPEFVEVLKKAIPGYTDRLAVRPGVTGLAQINLPPDKDLHGVCRKVTLDVSYIQSAGPILDARVLLCTAVRLVGFSGDTAAGLLRLRREVAEPRYHVRSGNGSQSGRAFGTPAGLAAASGNGNGDGQVEIDGFDNEQQDSPTTIGRPKPR